MKLGRLGAWYSTEKMGGPAQIKEFDTVERLGYDTLWYPDPADTNPFPSRVSCCHARRN